MGEGVGVLWLRDFAKPHSCGVTEPGLELGPLNHTKEHLNTQRDLDIAPSGPKVSAISTLNI